MSKIIMPPGEYYIGDLGYALGVDFPSKFFNFEEFQTGLYKTTDGRKYWISKTKHRSGTVYTQDGRCWGFDYGCFGCMLLKDITSEASYGMHFEKFSEPFEVSSNNNEIIIGSLNFSYEPPKDKEPKGLHLPEFNF